MSNQPAVPNPTIRLVLIILAVVLIILAAFALKVDVNLFYLGIAAFFASFIF